MLRLRTKIERNIIKKIVTAFPKESSDIIGKITLDVFNYAQQIIPRDTNFMANSGEVRHRPGELYGEVYYGADYSGMVHEGTAITKPQPWLRRSSVRFEPAALAAFKQLESRLPH